MLEHFFRLKQTLSVSLADNIFVDIIISILILALFLALRKAVTSYILTGLLKLTSKTKTNLDYNIVRSFQRPVRALIVVTGTFLAYSHLPITQEQIEVGEKAFKSMFIISLSWGIFNLTNSYTTFIVDIGKRLGLSVDELLVPFLSKLARLLIFFFGLSVVADVWDYNVSALVTGLGIGGLAFALAAQDALKNIFGGVVIITEKPFKKGDWIQTPSVEGTVEDITFRSTLIRTFAQAIVTIPNSKLSNEPITNWTQMGKRRITFNLGVEYRTTSEKMQSVVGKIEHMLKSHEEIDQETIFVKFNEFNNSSLDIFLYFFTKTTNWEEWLTIKQDCNLRIMKILEEEGVQAAFPSQSVYFESELKLTT